MGDTYERKTATQGHETRERHTYIQHHNRQKNAKEPPVRPDWNNDMDKLINDRLLGGDRNHGIYGGVGGENLRLYIGK